MEEITEESSPSPREPVGRLRKEGKVRDGRKKEEKRDGGKGGEGKKEERGIWKERREGQKEATKSYEID